MLTGHLSLRRTDNLCFKCKAADFEEVMNTVILLLKEDSELKLSPKQSLVSNIYTGICRMAEKQDV